MRRIAAWLLLPAFSIQTSALDVQGHRGCRGLLPENTLPAFERALELGVTTLELDVQTTRDRVVIVRHDQQINTARCESNDGSPLGRSLFKDLTFDELSGIDCGSRPHREFPDQVPAPGAGIPRLRDVLALARAAPYAVQLSIEIKMQNPQRGIPYREAARLTVDLIEEYDLVARSIIQSFEPEILIEVHALNPEIRRAVLVRHAAAYDRLLEQSGARILSPRHRGLKRSDVERFHARGIQIIPWTVNKPDAIRRMIEWGVDGLITDYPDRVLALLSESSR